MPAVTFGEMLLIPCLPAKARADFHCALRTLRSAGSPSGSPRLLARPACAPLPRYLVIIPAPLIAVPPLCRVPSLLEAQGFPLEGLPLAGAASCPSA